MSLRPGVLLYNPISNEGHLDSWHVLFIQTFLTAGWKVVPVSADPQGLRLKLERKGLWQHPQLLWPKDREEASTSLLEKTLGFCRRVLRKLSQLFDSAEQQTQRALTARFLDPQVFKNDIDHALAQHASDVGLILNMYVDGYLAQSPSWRGTVFTESGSSSTLQMIPWAGLCITPERLGQDQQTPPAYYDLAQYRGTCFLQEDATQEHQHCFPNKHFAFLPDITDTDLPTEPNALAIKIKQRAAGRKIVLLGGSIGKQKNIVQWANLICNADPKKWYFVQVGRISHNNLSKEDKHALAILDQRHPENFYIHAEYLPDETSFNAILADADIIFAVYRDFYRSSNMLSKAAYFEKPILVSSGCLMGDRVARYGIGLAVTSTSASEILAGLDAALQIDELQLKFAAYRAVFSRAEFDRNLMNFATRCLPRSSPSGQNDNASEPNMKVLND
jgi:hypothetical protein